MAFETDAIRVWGVTLRTPSDFILVGEGPGFCLESHAYVSTRASAAVS